MKNKLVKILIGLGLVFPVLAGCGQKRNDTPKQDDTTQPSGDNNTQEPGRDETPLDDTTGIPTYEGNTAKQVRTIPNTPVTAYKAETLARIKYVASITSESIYDDYVNYMLELGVGDELAMEFCDFMEGMYRMTMKGFNIYDASVLGENGEDLIDLCYQGLAIINSFDVSKVESVLTRINEASREDYLKRYNELTIAEYFDVSINGLNYSRYKELKSLKTKINDSSLNNLLSSYESAIQNFYFSAEQQAEFNDYKAQLRENSQNGGLIPQGVITLLHTHASDARELLVKDLKLIVDAFGECVPEILNAIKKQDSEFCYSYTYTDPNYGYTNTRSHYLYSERGEMIRSIINAVIKNKNVVLGVLKAVYLDVKLGNILLDAFSTIYLPILEEQYENDTEMAPKVAQLKTRVNALSGKHVSALFSFLLKVINQVSREDLVELLVAAYGGNDDFDYAAFGDKYIGQLDAVIASVTAQEKQLILETSQIFGLDILAELTKFSTIYKTKDLSTNAGKEKFADDVADWAEELYEKAYENVFCFFGGGGHSARPDERNYWVNVSVNNTIFVGQTVQSSMLYIEFDDYGDGIHVYGSISSINSDADYYQQRLDSMSDEEKADMNPEELQYYQERASARISNVVISADTSHVGNVPFTVSFTLAGRPITYKGYLTVYSSSMPIVYNSYLEVSYSSSRLYSDSNVSIVEKGQEAYYYSYNQNVVDTSTSGWHFASNTRTEDGHNYYYYVVYYVTTLAELNPYLVETRTDVGVILSDRTYFERNPYKNFIYNVDGFLFRRNVSLSYSQDLVSGKQTNRKYTATSDGVQFEYVIIDSSKPAYTSYYFCLKENLDGITIATPTTKTLMVREHYRYVVEVDGVFYTASSNSNEKEETVSNFTYVNDVVSFTYKGVAYRFIDE